MENNSINTIILKLYMIHLSLNQQLIEEKEE